MPRREGFLREQRVLLRPAQYRTCAFAAAATQNNLHICGLIKLASGCFFTGRVCGEYIGLRLPVFWQKPKGPRGPFESPANGATPHMH